MDIEVIKYRSNPVGSISLLTDRTLVPSYFERIFQLQPNLQNMLFSLVTGAYLRGLTRNYALQVEEAPQLALSVLRVAIGEITLAQLPSLISTELKVANDKAQAIATDIEKELFAPIMLAYNQSLRSQKATASPSLQPSAGAQNVLDLKQQMANRPLQVSLAPASRPMVATSRPVAPLRPVTPSPIPRPVAPKSVFPPPPSSSSSRPPNVPW